jgi:hypothetical protein
MKNQNNNIYLNCTAFLMTPYIGSGAHDVGKQSFSGVDTAHLGNFVFAYFLMLDMASSTFHPCSIRYIIHQMLATMTNT